MDALISGDEDAEDEDCFEDGTSQSPATKRKSITHQMVKMPSADAALEGRRRFFYEIPCIGPNITDIALLA